MSLRTRGSATIDRAERRLASWKSIGDNLDLGYGITVEAYEQLIDATRSAIESHNIMVSQFDESRRNVDALEQQLADFSAKVLSAVSIKYGRRSNEYVKAGGTIRKSRKAATQSASAASAPQSSGLEATTMSNGNGNGNGKAISVNS